MSAIKGRVIYDIDFEQNDELIPHCCEEMNFHVNNKEKIILYLSNFREYGFRIDENIAQLLNYCPWCSNKFKKSLREEFFKVVKIELKKETSLFEISELPKEFQTDEWWKKRNL